MSKKDKNLFNVLPGQIVAVRKKEFFLKEEGKISHMRFVNSEEWNNGEEFIALDHEGRAVCKDNNDCFEGYKCIEVPGSRYGYMEKIK